MYSRFNLKIQLEDYSLESSAEIEKWKNMGQQSKLEFAESTDSILERYVKGEILYGSALAEEWFEIIKSDIFISHSHNDQELALVLAGWLKDKFNLKVFLDEVIWGSADELLLSIDNRYCKKTDDTYDYNKRNLTTSHVHAMLTTAILNSIDKTEVVLFLNTENSVPKIENVISESGNYTLSPWIYEEIVATNVLKRHDWREYRITSVYENAENLPQIAYKLPIEDIKEIGIAELRLWEENYNKSKIARKGRRGDTSAKNFNHPLNYLYSTVEKTQD